MPKNKIDYSLQINSEGELHHLLSIEGLSQEHIIEIFNNADKYVENGLHQGQHDQSLEGKTIVLLFFENSTRTYASFALAAERLGGTLLNFNLDTSAIKKGESVIDMILNLQAMHVDAFVIRHQEEGINHQIAEVVDPHVSILNAGDGCHAHPSQALLDAYTIRAHKPSFSNLKVAIVGDIKHSRVARSQIQVLSLLDVGDIRLVGPKDLLPEDLQQANLKFHTDLNEGINDADVIITLRIQKERMQNASIPNANEYFKRYGISSDVLAVAAKDVIVIHPGPMNRGIEIDSEVADGTHSVILQQVNYGVAIRMAIFRSLLG